MRTRSSAGPVRRLWLPGPDAPHTVGALSKPEMRHAVFAAASGYVAELKAQIAFLSERAALLGAQLAEKAQEAELLRAHTRASEIAPGAEVAPDPVPNGGETP